MQGEEGELQPPPEATFHPADDYPDVYINESFEANELIEAARRLAERRRWEEAARGLDRAMVQYGDKMIRRASGRYRPVGDRVRELIAGWPPEGVAAYRRLFEAQARQQFEAALGERDPGAVHELLDRYYGTTVAIEMADTLAQWSIEAGGFAEAASIYRKLLRDQPEVRASPGEILGRLAVVYGLAGDAEAARQWLERAAAARPNPTLRWLGQDRPLEGVVEELLSPRFGSAGSQTPFEWPTFGGGRDRNREADFLVDEVASLWRLDLTGAGFAPGPGVEEKSLSYQQGLESGRYLTLNPVTARGLIFVNNAFTAQALEADSGTVAWSYYPFDADSFRGVDLEDTQVLWHGASYSGGRLYMVVGDESVSYYSDRATGLPSTLVCLDAITGEEVWRTTEAGFDERFSRCVFDPTPLVAEDQVFVVVRRRRSFGFEDCYLCRFDAHTGQLGFRTHLGGASTGAFGYQRATLSFPTMVDGVIFVATNLGTVAAVNAYSGRVVWLTLYRRRDGSPEGNDEIGVTAPWCYNPVLADGERLLCKPLDGPALLVLETSTGEVREVLPASSLANLVSLLGVRRHVLYGLGDAAWAYDLAQRRLLWSAPLPPGERLYGRGLLTAERLLVPTRTGLCQYTRDGAFAGKVPWESPQDAGNAVAMSDRLVIAGNQRISAYARKADVWARLREKLAAAPHDPAPALDLAEVALRGGERVEAIAFLEAAVERAGGFTALVAPELKRRVFDDCLALAEKTAAGPAPDMDAAIRILGYAAQCAPDLAAEIAYRVRLAELHLQSGRPEAAVELYQQMLADRSLRSAPMPARGGPPHALIAPPPPEEVGHPPEEVGHPHPVSVSSAAIGDGQRTAGAFSRGRIDRLIELHGREVYARFETRACEWLEAGSRTADLALLERVVKTYPNADAAAWALIESADILRRAGRANEAVRRLTAAYRRYGGTAVSAVRTQARSLCHGARIDAPQVMRLIADCYVDAGRPEAAWAWLTKAGREYPTALLESDGRRVTPAEYRARLGDIRARVEPSRPAMQLPLDQTFVRTFDAPCYLLDPLDGELPQTAWDGFYVYSDAQLHLFDVAHHRPRWAAPAPCRMKPELLSATAERAVFATRHQVFALDPRDGRRVWEYGTYPADLGNELADHEMFATFRVHGIGRDCVVSFQDSGLVACLERMSGRVTWEKIVEWHRRLGGADTGETPVPLRAIGPVAVSDLWVAFAASRGGEDLYCLLDLETGETLNVIEPHDNRRVQRMFASLADLLVVTTQSIRCYDPYTGESAWAEERSRPILAETLQVDLEGLYFSDDGHQVVKLDLERGRPAWKSDRLPFRFADGVEVTLDRDLLIVSTERSVSGLDAFDGRLLWEGTIPPQALLGRRFVTDGYVVALENPVSGAPGPYRAYFLDHRHADGRLAPHGGVLELGVIDGVKHVTVRDHAVLLAGERAVYGWYRGPAGP